MSERKKVSPGRRRSRLSRGVEDTFDGALMNTRMLAVNYDPGEIRLRFHVIRDYISLLRARYMVDIFRLSCVIVLLQLAYSAELFNWYPRMKSLTEEPEAVAQIKVVDAVQVIVAELGSLRWPLLILCISFLFRRSRSIYLVDFVTFDPPDDWKVTKEQLVTILRNAGHQRQSFDEPDVTFMEKVLANSGTGEATAWPPSMIKVIQDGVVPDESMQAARTEAEAVICSSLQRLLDQTGVRPKDIDILVVNCSLFSPTPSLCAMVANKFGCRTNIKTFNLSGMGCSASLLAVDLASELLQNNPGSTAVVISTELISQSLYHGHEKSMLLQNTLFRCGGAAILLSNKPTLSFRAKYRLKSLVRTQCCDDESYGAVFECQDSHGHSGIRLSKKIVEVAGNAMKINLTNLGPQVLPLSEQLKVVFSIIGRRFNPEIKRYVPSFKTAIDFFCIHAGGRAVLDGIEKNLRLLPEDMLPSRSVLHERGNTSSSSIWYELAHIEQHKPLRRGHQVLQLAFGSGFKCNSAVWRRLR